MHRNIVASSLVLGLGLAAPATASAFCGFYVSGADGRLYAEATMVVMMRAGTRTVLSMQNSYQGPPEDFAMVVPVPVVLREENVKTLPREVFSRVDQLAAPRLVEYWEQDPCYVPRVRMRRASVSGRGSGINLDAASSPGRHGVRIEAEFAVAEYDIVILSARDSSGLDRWLREEHYNIPEGTGEVLRPYVESGTKFFVAKVDVERVTFENGRAMLSPLRVHYDSPEFSLPVRLGLLNSQGTQDLIVHVLSPGQRYEVANYRNTTIPTNIRVVNGVRRRFGEFYAQLFDKTVERSGGAVVTEYSWQAMGCDPCPTDPLNESELTTLGLDVLGAGAASAARSGGPGAMVLTRLHYRYDRASLGDDLVFRPARAIIGGRGEPNARGRMEERTEESTVNQFQGRYVILHRWSGPVECARPERGRWGGPPRGVRTRPPSATGTAFVSRRFRTPLERSVRDAIPELGIRPGSAPSRPPSAPTPTPTPTPSRKGGGATDLVGAVDGRARESARVIGR